MATSERKFTRRNFINMVTSAGGAALAYEAMLATGLAATPGYSAPLLLKGKGDGISIIILGAGLAGMASAYELGKLGYRVTILEALDRPGGRLWTLRGGNSWHESSGTKQVCRFDNGYYFEPGPRRISHHHKALLHYCKTFGIPLHVYSNHNAGAFFHGNNVGPLSGKPIMAGDMIADFRGHTSELLAKAINQNALDKEFNQNDKELLMAYLKKAGGLDEAHKYDGAGRRSQSNYGKPYKLSELLEFDLWKRLGHTWNYEQQMTMLAPDGGMDSIANGFMKAIHPKVRFGSKVTKIVQNNDGVQITYLGAKRGASKTIMARYCICTLPLPVLRKLTTDFSPAMTKAIKSVPYWPSVKIGLQFRRRFWEEEDSIYGGSTQTNLDISEISYPSEGFHLPKGILTGAYMLSRNAIKFAKMHPRDRLIEALAQGVRIHSQYLDQFESGVSVAWNKMPYARGCYSKFSPSAQKDYLPLLRKPDRRVYLAGEHLSHLHGWMEGAILSAHDVVNAIHKRVMAKK